MAEFKGFGFTSPEEVVAKTQAGFQQAMASGNPNAMRMAVAQMGAFAVGGSPELRKAKQTQKILTESFKNSQIDGEDDLQNEMNYYRSAARAAADAGLPDLAIQATERLSALSLQKENRDLIRVREEREAERFEEEREDEEREDLEERLADRQNFAKIGVNAYREVIEQGGSELEARQKARKAQLVWLGAQTESGDIGAGTELAKERGIDLSVDSFDINEAMGLSTDTVREYKGMTTVIGEDGNPKLAFVIQGPNGPELRPTEFDDAGLLAKIQAANAKAKSGGNITDAERKNAAYALNMLQSQKTLARLDWTENDFTTVGKTIESSLPNRIKGEALQEFENAKEAFINSWLRRQSGATIKDDEYTRAEKYLFPMPGDTRNTVEAKRRFRQSELAGVMAAAGDAAMSDAYQTFIEVQMEDERAAELYELGF